MPGTVAAARASAVHGRPIKLTSGSWTATHPQLEEPLRPMWNRSWLSYRTKPPLFPREINCFERPHLEGLIFWRVLGERLAGRSRRERADSTFGRAGSRQLEPTSRALGWA
jgi:hypothetical protein